MVNTNPYIQAVKDMSNNRRYCEPSIARVYAEHARGTDCITCPPPISLETRCVHNHTSKPYTDSDPLLTQQLKERMRMKYRTAGLDVRLWVVHKIAKIGGVLFTAGESIEGVKRSNADKMLRCGSVITLVLGGRSLYAWVIRFLSFDSIHLAHVRWLPIPEYPCGTPVIVTLRNGGRIPRLPSTLDLTDIDPSRIAILNEDTFKYVMRLTGIDTMSV